MFFCVLSLVADSEEDLSSVSDPSSTNSTPQSEGKAPLSPRDFWRERDGSFNIVIFIQFHHACFDDKKNIGDNLSAILMRN